MVGYFSRATREINGPYAIQSDFVRYPSFCHEYIYLHNINKWKIKNLLYNTTINLYPAKESNNLKSPLAYSLEAKALILRGPNTVRSRISPYLALKYDVFPNISEDSEGLFVRVSKNIYTGLGLSYSYYLKEIKLGLASDYLIDLSSNSTAKNSIVKGSISGAVLSLKLRLAYAYGVSFIDSWFIESAYTTSLRKNSAQPKQIEISTNSFATNLGFSF